jgi:hypothetical protein
MFSFFKTSTPAAGAAGTAPAAPPAAPPPPPPPPRRGSQVPSHWTTKPSLYNNPDAMALLALDPSVSGGRRNSRRNKNRKNKNRKNRNRKSRRNRH